MKLICHFDILKRDKKNRRGRLRTCRQTRRRPNAVIQPNPLRNQLPYSEETCLYPERLRHRKPRNTPVFGQKNPEKEARRRHVRISKRGGNMLVWRDQTFCKPEHSTKPECADCFRRFDKLKYSDYCKRYQCEPLIAWALEPMCEPKPRNDKTNNEHRPTTDNSQD